MPRAIDFKVYGLKQKLTESFKIKIINFRV